MLQVEQRSEDTVDRGYLSAPTVLKSLLDEFSAVTDYRTLRDSLPRRLASLLKCRCVLLYQCIGETLQFASGTFDEKPGWSSSLLAVAHINPISTSSDAAEALAWRTRQTVTTPAESSFPMIVAVPLIYRQRAIGVLVAIRGDASSCKDSSYDYWSGDEVQVVEVVAGVTAMLLENTRLLERDRERIHELSLLNSISSQFNRSMRNLNRVRSIVVQRVQEISAADLCELILPSTPLDAIPWITPGLREMLLQPKNGRPEPNSSPLIIERPGDFPPINSTSVPTTMPYPHGEYLRQLAPNIKTFFAIPLVTGSKRIGTGEAVAVGGEARAKVLGVVVGAYHRPWKLHHAELVLLQVLASQASAVLENMSLLAEVVEARTEARKLLRQVLDDQRLKESIVTSVHRLEEEKRRLDRLATLGEMAANVAHEVRNPLASIKTSVQMLMDDQAGDHVGQLDGIGWVGEGVQESLSIVLKEVERLDAIVRDLLLFARPRQLYRIPCNLVELSNHVLQCMRAQCDEASVLVRRVYQEVPMVRVDVDQIEQVLFNLYMNALQAMHDGGVLTVTCQVISNWLELSVSDTGVGIPPDQLERIFQPFFTTKAHGIGLGLPITRRLVEDHGGQILVDSQFGYGTTVSVRLPLAGD